MKTTFANSSLYSSIQASHKMAASSTRLAKSPTTKRRLVAWLVGSLEVAHLKHRPNLNTFYLFIIFHEYRQSSSSRSLRGPHLPAHTYTRNSIKLCAPNEFFRCECYAWVALLSTKWNEMQHSQITVPSTAIPAPADSSTTGGDARDSCSYRLCHFSAAIVIAIEH